MTIQELIDVIEGGEWHLDECGCLTDSNDDCSLWHAYRLIDPDSTGDAEDYFGTYIPDSSERK